MFFPDVFCMPTFTSLFSITIYLIKLVSIQLGSATVDSNQSLYISRFYNNTSVQIITCDVYFLWCSNFSCNPRFVVFASKDDAYIKILFQSVSHLICHVFIFFFLLGWCGQGEKGKGIRGPAKLVVKNDEKRRCRWDYRNRKLII